MEFYYLNKMNVVPMPLLMLNLAEVLEGSSGEDEVEDKTFGRIFTRSRTRRGIFPFPSAFSRTRRGIPRNLGLFLSHFKDETSRGILPHSSAISWSRRDPREPL